MSSRLGEVPPKSLNMPLPSVENSMGVTYDNPQKFGAGARRNLRRRHLLENEVLGN
ncbi:hypothetical protein [Natronoglycomyces albus]|uniref:Uncharacterized protein n=1 Tax=Natronoglycomyces albus TaxID=2811108 RepID=A0A895XR85_9ACTN|nr:hypothetical protein [Natronoglycomyces albus]QSB04780.1 hypothetical protein JQS30_13560 [Natronoglycomyces albus]